jgi:hypothetical protein
MKSNDHFKLEDLVVYQKAMGCSESDDDLEPLFRQRKLYS